MPLILAFYCIVGGDRPSPTVTDLYAKVIRRILTASGAAERRHMEEADLSTGSGFVGRG